MAAYDRSQSQNGNDHNNNGLNTEDGDDFADSLLLVDQELSSPIGNNNRSHSGSANKGKQQPPLLMKVRSNKNDNCLYHEI
jgi:hypothetical protein